VLLGIGCHRDFEVGDGADSADQIGGVLVALRMGFKTHANASRRIAPERQYVADARVPIFSHHGVHFILGRAHTGEMGHGLELCLVANALHRAQGAVARGAAGAIGDGNEIRIDRFKALQGAPEGVLGVAGLGREELE